MKRNLYDALSAFYDKKNPFPSDFRVGKVVSVSPTQMMVRIKGASTPQPATVPLEGAAPGDMCLLARPHGERIWQTITTVSDMLRGDASGLRGNPVLNDNTQDVVIAPENPREGPRLPNVAVFTWDSNPQFRGIYRVQVASDSDGSDASLLLTTRGSYAMIQTDSPKYFRVRAIAPNRSKSGWTPWIVCKPQGVDDDSGIVPVVDTILTYCGQVLTYNGNVLTYTPPIS